MRYQIDTQNKRINIQGDTRSNFVNDWKLNYKPLWKKKLI